MKGITIFLQGVLVGVVIAFPKGPAGFLVINQTIVFGAKDGFITAFGPIMTTFVSSLIILYVSGFGTYIQSLKNMTNKKSVHIISCVILICVGVYIFYINANTGPSDVDETTEVSFKLFLLTFLEPTLFPLTFALFIKLAPKAMTGDVLIKMIFYCGIVFGTVLFYVGLCSFFHWLVVKNSISDITIISKVIGIIFIGSGVLLLLVIRYKACLLKKKKKAYSLIIKYKTRFF